MVEEEFRIEGMSADDTVLVAGPPMTGKYRLLLRILVTYSDRILFVSTRNDAERVRSDFADIGGFDADRLTVIDCVSRRDGRETTDDTDAVRYVGSPQNLTDIGVSFTELHGEFSEVPVEGGTGVGIHSVSQLLMHADVKTVYQFLQVLFGQIRAAGWLGVAVVDTGTVEEEQVRMLQHHFDGMIETRENDDGERQFRSRGFTPQASGWTAF